MQEAQPHLFFSSYLSINNSSRALDKPVYRVNYKNWQDTHLFKFLCVLCTKTRGNLNSFLSVFYFPLPYSGIANLLNHILNLDWLEIKHVSFWWINSGACGNKHKTPRML